MKYAINHLNKKVCKNIYMDIFKNLPFDIQERIYKEVIYKKRYDNFVKDFNNLILNLIFMDYHFEMTYQEMKLEEALINTLENINQIKIGKKIIKKKYLIKQKYIIKKIKKE